MKMGTEEEPVLQETVAQKNNTRRAEVLSCFVCLFLDRVSCNLDWWSCDQFLSLLPKPDLKCKN